MENTDFLFSNTQLISATQILSINSDLDNAFQEAIRLEYELYTLIKYQGNIISSETHQSLIYLYGRIVSYLLARGSEEYQVWLKNAFKSIQMRLINLTNDIIKAEACDCFAKSLKVNVLEDGEGKATGGLETLVNEKQAKANADKQKEKIDLPVKIGLFVVGTGITIACASNPIGWLGAIAILANAAKIANDEVYKRCRKPNFIAYYNGKFSEIINDFKKLKTFIEADIQFHELRRQQIQAFKKVNYDTIETFCDLYQQGLLDDDSDIFVDKSLLQEIKNHIANKRNTAKLLSDQERKILLDNGYNLDELNEENIEGFRELYASVSGIVKENNTDDVPSRSCKK